MITVTEKALTKMSRLAEAEGVPKVLRVRLKKSACADYKYIVEFAKERREDDTTAEFGDVTIVCDPKSLELIEGSNIDYSTSLTNRGFKFSNPRETGSCACGISVSFSPNPAPDPGATSPCCT